jgi:hypothetical protein
LCLPFGHELAPVLEFDPASGALLGFCLFLGTAWRVTSVAVYRSVVAIPPDECVRFGLSRRSVVS